MTDQKEIEVEVPASMLEGKPKIHKYITLPNGLDVLLISDPATEQSAASMDCKVGQFNDPVELPGLAHFTEHMMFLGTEKYPQENSYNSYLTEHGGSCNAYTSYEHTNYIFNVISSALEGALDRFAQFFITPLFTDSATERELMAVESENQRFLTEDYMRFIMFLKDIADPTHPFSNFGCGNIETLRTTPASKGIDVRKHLFEFQKFYTARSMKLCVYGKEPIDVLKAMVTKYFVEIPDKSPPIPQPWEDVFPFDRTKLGKIYQVAAVNENTRLHMFWPVKGGYGLYKTKPTRYIAHIIGHECEGSILWVLKQRGWATELLAGSVLDMSKIYTLFEVEIYLTSEGYQHLEEVVGLIYQQFRLVTNEGFSEKVWTEVCDTAAMEFSYGDMPSPYRHTSHCSAAMLKYDPEYTLSGDLKMFEKDSNAVMEMLKDFTPDNAVMAVKRPSFDGEEAVVLNKTSRFYDNKYGVRELSKELLDSWRKPASICKDLTMPHINPFIPHDFSLTADDDEGEQDHVPLQILRRTADSALEKPEISVYHWKDTVYKVPKVSMKIKVASPVAYSSPKSRVLNRIFVRILKEQTNTVTYYALIANLNLDILSSTDGLEVYVGGLSQKIGKLLELVWKAIDSVDPPEELFNTSLSKISEDLVNFNRKQAVIHASEQIGLVTHFTRWSVKEVLDAAKTITHNDMLWYIKEFRKNVAMTILATGNITKDETLKTAKSLQEWYLDKCGALPYSLYPQHSRILKLPKGKNFIIPMKGHNPENKSTVVDMYIQFGVESPRLITLVDILARLLDSLFFNSLRTSEQLGYVVSSYQKQDELIEGFKFLVQSAVCSPWYAYCRIHCFIDALDDWIQKVTDEDFQSVVNAEIERRKDTPKTLNKQTDVWWKRIENRTKVFDQHLKEIAVLEETKKQDFVTFFETYVSNKSPKRRSVTAFIYGKNHFDEIDAITKQWKETNGDKPTFSTTRVLDTKVDLIQGDVPDVVVPPEVLELISNESLPPHIMAQLSEAGITPSNVLDQGVTPELTRIIAPLLPDQGQKEVEPPVADSTAQPHLSSISLSNGAGLPPLPLTYVMSHGGFKLGLPSFPAWNGY
eukprot:TRINITY_DN17103_c0_g1_i1.p1 TRINITY_DN17103_c0_g1~~TRINITY_DN17103_c0_g1_i1.p1  ORF type:complete len:1092 (+),score=202.38 TRINITY_DN17103_c0_g1_i1:66-3341(+)